VGGDGWDDDLIDGINNFVNMRGVIYAAPHLIFTTPASFSSLVTSRTADENWGTRQLETRQLEYGITQEHAKDRRSQQNDSLDTIMSPVVKHQKSPARRTN